MLELREENSEKERKRVQRFWMKESLRKRAKADQKKRRVYSIRYILRTAMRLKERRAAGRTFEWSHVEELVERETCFSLIWDLYNLPRGEGEREIGEARKCVVMRRNNKIQGGKGEVLLEVFFRSFLLPLNSPFPATNITLSIFLVFFCPSIFRVFEYQKHISLSIREERHRERELTRRSLHGNNSSKGCPNSVRSACSKSKRRVEPETSWKEESGKQIEWKWIHYYLWFGVNVEPYTTLFIYISWSWSDSRSLFLSVLYNSFIHPFIWSLILGSKRGNEFWKDN